MAFRDLWGAYAFACGRFGIDPGPRPGAGRPFIGGGAAKPATQATPSLTRAFLESAGTYTDGLGWFAELGAQIVRDIVERHGLESLVRRTAPDPEPDFEAYFRNRKLRP